jgi:hypothetical protein
MVVPLKRAVAREEVVTAIAEMDFQRLRFRGLAVTFELLKVFEARVRAETSLDCMDRPTRQVGLRSLDEQPIPRLEFAGYLEKLCRFLLLLLLCATPSTSPRPKSVPIRRFHRPTLVETRSQRASVRIRGREPLPSASRHTAFMPMASS